MYWHCVIAFLYLYFLFIYLSLSVLIDLNTKLAVFQDLFQIQFHMYNKSLNILIGPKNEAFINSSHMQASHSPAKLNNFNNA